MLAKSKEFYRGPFQNSGSMLITLIITIVIFSVLVVAMLSLTNSSIFSQLNTASTTKATYIAKSGFRYLASQYKYWTPATEVGRNLALDQNLHNKTFRLLGNNGSFLLNVKPYYLMSQQSLTIDTRNNLTLLVKFPGGVSSYTIPQSPTVDQTMAVYIPGTGWRRFYYRTVTGSAPNFTLHLSDTSPSGTINVVPGTSIVPVLSTPRTNPDQHLIYDGSLEVTGASGIYPARFGFFEMPDINNTNCSGYVYYYNSRTGDIFSGIRDANTPDRFFDCVIADATAARRRVYAHTSAEINSTGTYNPGLGPAVSNTFSRMTILGFNPGAVDIPHNIQGVDGWVKIATPDDSIAIDTGAQQIQLGRSHTDTAGVAWYAGNSQAANCDTGLCDFGLGIRVYFQFQDTYAGPLGHGDGFMFMLMNGILNDTTKRGGTLSGSGMGELMGYSGPGNTDLNSSLPRATPPLDGLGMEPPKISIEFDKYNNAGVSAPPIPPATDGDLPGCGNGRNDYDDDDDNTNDNHMALMFWGANTAGNCNNGLPAVSYDDNVHSAGIWDSNLVPRNSAIGDSTADGSRGYYATNLDNINTRLVRIEVTRAATPNGNGNYDYNIKAWIDCTGCDAAELVTFRDTSNPYPSPPTGLQPQINRTIELSNDPTTPLHANFHRMFFGFTEGTGAATQNILISNFNIYFIPY